MGVTRHRNRPPNHDVIIHFLGGPIDGGEQVMAEPIPKELVTTIARREHNYKVVKTHDGQYLAKYVGCEE